MDNVKIAARLNRIEQSASSLVSQRARELKAAGKDIVTLSSGEPDFPTPDHVIDAAFAAARAGQTRYTNAAGTPELKRAIIEKFKREDGLEYAENEVMASNGGKQVIFNSMVATVEPGDEVIVTAPYWISYVDLIKFGGGTPVIVPCGVEDDFKLTPTALSEAITPATRWLMLNSPSNPSGAVYSADDLAGLADVLRGHPQIMVFCDDIYQHIIYDGQEFATMAQVAPDLRDRIVTMNGVSKAYSMTGWRIGYCGAPAPLIKQMTKLQQQTTGSICALSQAAAVAALSGPQDYVRARTAEFESRRDLVVSMINQAPGLSCSTPKGAFYVFPSCAALIGKTTPDGQVIESDQDLVNYFLDSEGVAAVHGAAYGLSPFFRISFATSEAELRDACERIQRACAALV